MSAFCKLVHRGEQVQQFEEDIDIEYVVTSSLPRSVAFQIQLYFDNE